MYLTVLPLLLVLASANFLQPEHRELWPNTTWPNVTYPYYYEMKATNMTWNATSKTMTPLPLNMTLLQYFDTQGNRMWQQVAMTVEGTKIILSQLSDFKNGKYVQREGISNSCSENDITKEDLLAIL